MLQRIMNRHFFFRFLTLLLGLSLLVIQTGSSITHADSLPQSEIEALNQWPNWVANTPNQCSSAGSSASGGTTQPGSTGPANQVQIANARIIIGVVKTFNLPQSAALIALMVGLDESGLKVDANQTVPLSEQNPNKQGDGNNGTSLGIFQQQITTGWSTISTDINNAAAVNQLMTPAYEAQAFLGSPPG